MAHIKFFKQLADVDPTRVRIKLLHQPIPLLFAGGKQASACLASTSSGVPCCATATGWWRAGEGAWDGAKRPAGARRNEQRAGERSRRLRHHSREISSSSNYYFTRELFIHTQKDERGVGCCTCCGERAHNTWETPHQSAYTAVPHSTISSAASRSKLTHGATWVYAPIRTPHPRPDRGRVIEPAHMSQALYLVLIDLLARPVRPAISVTSPAPATTRQHLRAFPNSIDLPQHRHAARFSNLITSQSQCPPPPTRWPHTRTAHFPLEAKAV